MTGASWFHCSVKTVKRSSGRSVVAAAAYRIGESLYDREIDRTHDYTRRQGVHGSFTLVPEGAEIWAQNPEQLWNAANAAEKRINSTLAREVELALPASVTPEAREAIVREFSQALVDRYGVGVTAALHRPSRDGSQLNEHAHILFTTRTLDADGIGKKTRILDDRKTGPQEVMWLREIAADIINDALNDAGGGERVDHRSYADRGLEREATMHLGPEATEMERRGQLSEIGDVNRGVRARNHYFDELVNELAEVDREIGEAEEARLDNLYGSSGDSSTVEKVLPFKTGFGLSQLLDEESLASRPDDAETGLAVFLQERIVTNKSPAFTAVMQETAAQASIENAASVAESGGQGRGRFERARLWWDNMREYVAGWRQQVYERAGHYLNWWEKQEVQAERAEHSSLGLSSPRDGPEVDP